MGGECNYLGCPGVVSDSDDYSTGAVYPFTAPASRFEKRSSRLDIVVGRDQFGKPYGFSLEDLARNLLVVGLVGTGKTTLVKRVLAEAFRHGVGYLVFDWEGEYVDLALLAGARVVEWSSVGLDIWRPPVGMRTSDYVYYVSNVLIGYIRGRGWEVSPRMAVAVKRAVKHCVYNRGSGASCFREALEALGGDTYSRQTILAVESRLDLLLDGVLEPLSRGEDSFHGILRDRLVVDLSSIARLSRPAAKAVVELSLARVRASIMARKPKYDRANFLLVLEEAEELLRPEPWAETPLVSDLAHYRKRGAGMVIVTHGVSSIDRDVLLYIGNYAVFNTPSATEKRLLSEIIGDYILEWNFSSLGKGEAIIRTFTNPVPTLVSIEPPKGKASKQAALLLQSLREKPYLSQRQRRALLGLDGSTYRELVAELVDAGLVEIVEVYTGGPGRPPRLLALKGRNPSALHEYGVYQAGLLLGRVCESVEEGDRGRADLAAVCGDVRVGVEIETGSNLVREKFAQRLNDHDYIVVVCVSRKCLRKARRIASTLEGKVLVTTLYKLPSTVRKLATGRTSRTG